MTALVISVLLLTIWWGILLYAVMLTPGVESNAEWIRKRLGSSRNRIANLLLLMLLWPIMLSRYPMVLLVITASVAVIDYFLIR